MPAAHSSSEENCPRRKFKERGLQCRTFDELYNGQALFYGRRFNTGNYNATGITVLDSRFCVKRMRLGQTKIEFQKEKAEPLPAYVLPVAGKTKVIRNVEQEIYPSGN